MIYRGKYRAYVPEIFDDYDICRDLALMADNHKWQNIFGSKKKAYGMISYILKHGAMLNEIRYDDRIRFGPHYAFLYLHEVAGWIASELEMRK